MGAPLVGIGIRGIYRISLAQLAPFAITGNPAKPNVGRRFPCRYGRLEDPEKSYNSVNPDSDRMRASAALWIPAFAGMTRGDESGNDGETTGNGGRRKGWDAPMAVTRPRVRPVRLRRAFRPASWTSRHALMRDAETPKATRRRLAERGPSAHPPGLSATVDSLRTLAEGAPAVGASASDNRGVILV